MTDGVWLPCLIQNGKRRRSSSSSSSSSKKVSTSVLVVVLLQVELHRPIFLTQSDSSSGRAFGPATPFEAVAK